MKQSPDTYDTLVLGGGPAGSVLARQLARQGQTVLLLEGKDFSTPRVGETLSGQIQPLLQQLGLWESFLQTQPSKSYGISSSWADEEVHFKSHVVNPFGESWQVDRAAFDQMLFTAAAQQGVQTHLNTRIQSLKQEVDHSWWVKWQGNQGKQTAKARCFVNATGRKAAFAPTDYLRYQQFDQLAGIGLLQIDIPPGLTHLEIHACEQGWWYLAPLSDGQAVLLLMTDLDLIQSQQLTNPDHWLALFPETDRFISLRQCIPSNPRLLVKPAQSQLLQEISTHAYLPIGDALASFDPLYGQGVVRAIQTAIGAATYVSHTPDLTPASCQVFLDQLAGLYQIYLDQWSHFYHIVDRWPQAPFWQRRHALREQLFAPAYSSAAH